MKTKLLSLIASLTVMPLAGMLHAESTAELDQLLEKANTLISVRQADPDQAIPASLIAKAEGILIVQQYSGSFLVGASSGSGIGMVQQDGSWSAPSFYTVTSGSVGLQIGGQKTETIALLMTKEALDILNNHDAQWAFGGTAVAGPYGGNAAVSTVQDADMIVYQSAEGFEIGVSGRGGKYTPNEKANTAFYGQVVTPDQIFAGEAKTPAAAEPLIHTLDAISKQGAKD